jgi:hypothetical protein
VQTLEYCSNLSAAVEAAQNANQPPDKILDLVKPCQTVSKSLLQSKDSVVNPLGTVSNSVGKFFTPWKF